MVMWSERSQTAKTYHMIPFMWHSIKDKIIGTENSSSSLATDGRKNNKTCWGEGSVLDCDRD